MNSRRLFLRNSACLAAGTLASPSLFAQPVPRNALTIRQVIELIIKDIPGAPFGQTVDTIKAGDATQLVTGIATTMFATIDVIRKAAATGANFIIAHEPSFYNHADETTWLEEDDVYRYKKELLRKHRIVIWRNHDYIHTYRPDGVLTGVLAALGWGSYYDPANPRVVTIPVSSLQAIIGLCKRNLAIPYVKYIGELSGNCSRILLIPGAAGGRTQINAVRKEKPDLLICGELSEWETSEYIRDLRAGGSKTALLVLGHIPSEEPGSQWLAEWLQPKLPELRVTHIPSGDAMNWV